MRGDAAVRAAGAGRAAAADGADAARRTGRSRLPDLASRANALLAFALWAPDDALLMGLAVKLFADRQVQVPESVVAHMIREPGTLAGRHPRFRRPGRCRRAGRTNGR